MSLQSATDTQNKEAIKIPEVPSKLEQLHRELTDLEDCVANLEDRLSSVLQHNPPHDAPISDAVAGNKTSVAHQIALATGRVDSLTGWVRSMTARLEV